MLEARKHGSPGGISIDLEMPQFESGIYLEEGGESTTPSRLDLVKSWNASGNRASPDVLYSRSPNDPSEYAEINGKQRNSFVPSNTRARTLKAMRERLANDSGDRPIMRAKRVVRSSQGGDESSPDLPPPLTSSAARLASSSLDKENAASQRITTLRSAPNRYTISTAPKDRISPNRVNSLKRPPVPEEPAHENGDRTVTQNTARSSYYTATSAAPLPSAGTYTKPAAPVQKGRTVLGEIQQKMVEPQHEQIAVLKDHTPVVHQHYYQPNPPHSSQSLSHMAQPLSHPPQPMQQHMGEMQQQPQQQQQYYMPDKTPIANQHYYQQPLSQQQAPTTHKKRVAQAIVVNGKMYYRAGVLGRGGSSKVYRVLDEKNNLFAIKRVDISKNDAETRHSFINEIQLLEKLRGKPEIIRLVDAEMNENKKVLLMVMEMGETDLSKLLQEEHTGKAISLNFIRYIWEQMLEAVQVMHNENVVHTDLKPANFVLVKGRLKLIDFGISKAIASDTTNIGRDQQIGTANYMPPEALIDSGMGQGGKKLMKLGRAADVWSLGCILHQMVYGRAPFAHLRDLGKKIMAIQNPHHVINFERYAVPIDEKGNELRELAVPVPQDLVDTIQSCLIFEPKRRATIPDLLNNQFLRR